MVAAYKQQTHDALAEVYGALNKGQRQKLLKNDGVKTLFDRFNVETEE